MTVKQAATLCGALVIGIAIIVIFASLRSGPEQSDTGPEVKTVRTMQAAPVDLDIRARGHGSVRAEKTWQAVARVGGRITERHPDLESGNLITAGTELLRIDPTRYELAVASAKADLAGIEADRRQLEQRAANTRLLLQLERDRLALAEKELERIERLAERDAVSVTRLDEQTRNTLQQRQAVQSLDNELALIPAERDNLESRYTRAETALSHAREDLRDTRFTAPFDLRVHDASVELHEEVQPGQRLFTADSISRAEALIQIPIPQLRRLLKEIPGTPAAPEPGRSLRELHGAIDLAAIKAQLTLAGEPEVTWPAKVTRIASGLDPQTRTVQVVLSVEEPYRRANPPEKPPLVRDMYVHGELSVPVSQPALVVPAAAVHDQTLYLVNSDNRLERRVVTLGWIQGDLAVIQSGLDAGEQVILDDLVPAIEGAPLEPVPDNRALENFGPQVGGAQQ